MHCLLTTPRSVKSPSHPPRSIPATLKISSSPADCAFIGLHCNPWLCTCTTDGKTSFSHFFSDHGDLLLASCAQDTFIRIWRVSSDSKVQETRPEILCDKMPELKLTSNIFSVADKGVITNTS